MAVVVCRICSCVLPAKNRRKIFSESFHVKEQLKEVLGQNLSTLDECSQYVCYKCFNKLNRLSKIDFDINSRIYILKKERETIITDLKAKCIQNQSVQPSQRRVLDCTNAGSSTPLHRGKRIIMHTPTPRKVKMPKQVQSQGAIPAKRKLEISPGKVKVSFSGEKDKKVRARIVKEAVWTSLLKSLVRGDKSKALATKILKIPSVRQSLLELVMKEVNVECKNLCGIKRKSVLRSVSGNDLSEFSYGAFLKELHTDAPLLCNFLETVIRKQDQITFAVAAAVLLKNRNIHMSAIHHIIGQILDYGGATDETISTMHTLGLSVCPQTVNSKKGELLNRQEMKVKDMVTAYVEKRQIEQKIEKSKNIVESLTAVDTTSVVKGCLLSPPQATNENEFEMLCSTDPYYSYMFNPSNKLDSIYCEARTCQSNFVFSSDYSTPTDLTHTTLQHLAPASLCSEICGEKYEFPAVDTLYIPPMYSDSTASIERSKKILDQFTKKCEDKLCKHIPAFEVIGDNLDLTITPTAMTKDRQRQSIHWFLNIALQKRVESDLPDDVPVNDVMKMPSSMFLPNETDCRTLDQNMCYHIAKVLCKYVSWLKPFNECIPECIQHKYMTELSQKSEYRVLNLLDKSENKSEDMISILQDIHDKCVARTDDTSPDVIGKLVFGGDVLTNERAYTAQLAMINAESDFFRLGGIIHRPEGLHRMMNFVLIIYQQFYKISSANDQGTLFQLRNVLHRVDVCGPDGVTSQYRSHSAFIHDCLDAFILGAFLHYSGMQDLDAAPTEFNIPALFSTQSLEEQYKWVYQLAENVLNVYVKLKEDDVATMAAGVLELDHQEQNLCDMYDSERNEYSCTYCQKRYKTKGMFKRHLHQKHGLDFLPPQNENQSPKKDHIAVWRSSFMKMALLLRDTEDAFKFGDGDRIFRNAKFEMICAGVANHTKYRLWLWRLIAYECAILTPKQAMEYKWNCTASTSGGKGKNIPNDNLVETFVRKIKKKLKEQGSNVSYESARKIALAMQVQDDIQSNFHPSCTERYGNVDKTEDVKIIMAELQAASVFKWIECREYYAFRGFVDIFSRLKIADFHKWIVQQQRRAGQEMSLT